MPSRLSRASTSRRESARARAALNRAVQERREYVLPARFDDSPLPGLLSDMVAIDLRSRPPQQFATMISDSWLGSPSPHRGRRPMWEIPTRRPPTRPRPRRRDSGATLLAPSPEVLANTGRSSAVSGISAVQTMYGSGLRDRSADLERSWKLTSIAALAAPLAASWQSAFCTCGFWPKPPCRRCTMSGPRPVSALLRRRARPRACPKWIDFQTATLGAGG